MQVLDEEALAYYLNELRKQSLWFAMKSAVKTVLAKLFL